MKNESGKNLQHNQNMLKFMSLVYNTVMLWLPHFYHRILHHQGYLVKLFLDVPSIPMDPKHSIIKRLYIHRYSTKVPLGGDQDHFIMNCVKKSSLLGFLRAKGTNK